MSCGSSHIRFPIHIKNVNFLLDHPMNIHVQFELIKDLRKKTFVYLYYQSLILNYVQC